MRGFGPTVRERQTKAPVPKKTGSSQESCVWDAPRKTRIEEGCLDLPLTVAVASQIGPHIALYTSSVTLTSLVVCRQNTHFSLLLDTRSNVPGNNILYYPRCKSQHTSNVE